MHIFIKKVLCDMGDIEVAAAALSCTVTLPERNLGVLLVLLQLEKFKV